MRALRTVVAVGSTSADPRLIEYTLYKFEDELAAREAASLESSSLFGDAIQLDGGGSFAFLAGPEGPPGESRPGLHLLRHGPDVNATFRAMTQPDLVAVGGTTLLQPSDVATLTKRIRVDPVPDAQDGTTIA